MGVRDTQTKRLLSELLDAVKEWQTPVWPLVKPKPIGQMEIGLPGSGAVVLWPEENCPERAVVIEGGFTRSLHLNDEVLAQRVSVIRVRRAVAVCRDRISEARKEAASVLKYFPAEVARLEHELNALALLGDETPATRDDYKLLLPVAWRIQRLLQSRIDPEAVRRVAAGLIIDPVDHSITLTVNTNFTYIVYVSVRSEFYRLSVSISPVQGVTVFLEDSPVYEPFAALPRLARVAPDPYQAVRVAELLNEILLRLEG